MLPSVCRALVTTSIALLFFSGASAQRDYVVSNAAVPFSFYAGNEEFPAGDYVLDSSKEGFLSIHSKDGKINRQISVNLYGEPVKRTEARLVFAKRNGRYVLREIWGVLGKYVMTSEYGQQDNKDEQTQEVRLSYPG